MFILYFNILIISFQDYQNAMNQFMKLIVRTNCNEIILMIKSCQFWLLYLLSQSYENFNNKQNEYKMIKKRLKELSEDLHEVC